MAKFGGFQRRSRGDAELFEVFPPTGAAGTLCLAASRPVEIIGDVIEPPADKADIDVAHTTSFDVADTSETIADSRDPCL